MKDNFNFYKEVVYHILPRATGVWTPDISGANKNLVLVRAPFGQIYCCKFGTQNQVIRNSRIATILRDVQIPVPDIQPVQYADNWFELYPLISGCTMYEWLRTGQNRTDINNTYLQLLEYFDRMRHIDWSDINLGNMRHPHHMALHNTMNTNNAVLAYITAAFVKLMNVGPANDSGLYHHGLTPKNIVTSPLGRICGILDMDEVSICNKNYAFGVMAAKAHISGINIDTLISQYERISGDKLNRSQIATVADINNIGRNILWHCRTK